MEDVIVIGDGPVGLITALGLAQAGVRVRRSGGLGLTCGLLDSYALYHALAAVVLEGADDAVLDRYAAARRDVFVNRVSPQATAPLVGAPNGSLHR